MWLRWEHLKVCETQHWRSSCKMTGKRVFYVPILCARANGRWKIPKMSMHWVCVSRFTLPILICSPLWYWNQPPYPLKSPFFPLRYSRRICQIFISFFPPVSFYVFQVVSFHRSHLESSCCLSSLPMQATICSSILLELYINTFVRSALNSVQCTHRNECCAISPKFMPLRLAPTANMQFTSVKRRLILTVLTFHSARNLSSYNFLSKKLL
jgi:hypothetical protein